MKNRYIREKVIIEIARRHYLIELLSISYILNIDLDLCLSVPVFQLENMTWMQRNFIISIECGMRMIWWYVHFVFPPYRECTNLFLLRERFSVSKLHLLIKMKHHVCTYWIICMFVCMYCVYICLNVNACVIRWTRIVVRSMNRNVHLMFDRHTIICYLSKNVSWWLIIDYYAICDYSDIRWLYYSVLL